MLFVGNYIYSLDSKDRINIPARFRRLLPKESADSFVVTKGAERCIHLYPSSYWQRTVRRYWEVFHSNQIDFRRFTIWRYRDTREVQFDKQGRIQIPRVLIEYARLEKEVEIIGLNSRIELWNPKFCDEFVGKEDEKYMKMDADLSTPLPQEFSRQLHPQSNQPYQGPAPPPPPVTNPGWGYPPGYGAYPYPPNYPPGYYPYNPNAGPGYYPNSPSDAQSRYPGSERMPNTPFGTPPDHTEAPPSKLDEDEDE